MKASFKGFFGKNTNTTTTNTPTQNPLAQNHPITPPPPAALPPLSPTNHSLHHPDSISLTDYLLTSDQASTHTRYTDYLETIHSNTDNDPASPSYHHHRLSQTRPSSTIGSTSQTSNSKLIHPHPNSPLTPPPSSTRRLTHKVKAKLFSKYPPSSLTSNLDHISESGSISPSTTNSTSITAQQSSYPDPYLPDQLPANNNDHNEDAAGYYTALNEILYDRRSSMAPSLASNSKNNVRFKASKTKTRRKRSTWASFKDSFTIVNNNHYTKSYDYSSSSSSTFSDDDNNDPENNHHRQKKLNAGVHATAKAPLIRGLKPRHMQMIAFGGAIGTGLFIRSGSSLSNGGPASLVIGFTLTGIMLTFTIQALGELAVQFPVSGSFSTYASRFLDPAWGFAMGWNYAIQWLTVFPLELVAAAITVKYWAPEDTYSPASVNSAAWISLFLVAIAAFNLFGVKVFGEIEFFFSILKICAITGFIIMGIVLISGGGPTHGYIGGRYWHDPGSFANGFKGVVAAFVNASFSYIGTELSGLAAAEAKNPRRAVPSAVKKVCWRIILFYIVSLIIVGCLVPYTDPRLISTEHVQESKSPRSSVVDVSTSPFVIAIKEAGIKGLPSVFNAVILISVLSVASSSVYAASRCIAGLAAMGQAPRQFSYIDKAGRPIYALLFSLLFGFLAYIGASTKEAEVFNWLLSLSGLSCIFTWGSICLCHIRFRQGLKAQGRNTSELAFKAPLGIWGSLVGLLINIVILGLLVWIGLFPIGSQSADPQAFFEVYLAGPIILLFYIPYKLYYKTTVLKVLEMDLDTGRRQNDVEILQLELAEEKLRMKTRGRLYYFYKIWC